MAQVAAVGGAEGEAAAVGQTGYDGEGGIRAGVPSRGRVEPDEALADVPVAVGVVDGAQGAAGEAGAGAAGVGRAGEDAEGVAVVLYRTEGEGVGGGEAVPDGSAPGPAPAVVDGVAKEMSPGPLRVSAPAGAVASVRCAA